MRRLELTVAAVLILAGAASLAAQRWVFVDPTQPGDWERAAAWTIERLDDGDVFRIEPWWYERALTYFVEVGDHADRVRSPIVEDLYRHDEIFIVAQTDRLDQALSALPYDAKPSETESFDTVTVARVKAPRDAFTWELLPNLQSAVVSHVTGDHVERCSRWTESTRRWDCKKQSRWLYVGEALREMGDDPRSCVWAHPLDKGRTLRIESEVPQANSLRVRGSFDLRAARLPRDGSVLMQIFIDDELAAERHIAHDDHAYAPVDLDLSQKQGPVKLRVEIDLKGSIKDRYFCMNAWAR